ncbi:MAG: hypothetical protein ACXVLQ_17235 [Bacteriovorax sp.]
MKDLKQTLFFFFIVLLSHAVLSQEGITVKSKKHKISKGLEAERLLSEAKLEMSRGAYDSALKHLIEYRKATAKMRKAPLMSFFVVESIGRIYLRVKQDPDAAIAFFSEALNDSYLSDSEFDLIKSFRDRAKEWKNLNMLPKNINDPITLFTLGKKYYQSGIKTQKFTMDVSASADFSLATNYLIPFTIRFDKDPNIGEALYMMGEIRRRSWHNNDYWTENFYLTEVIRRFPHTDLASKAYEALYEDVHFGYTGSSGDNTPQSWVDLLKEFKALSEVKASSVPPSTAPN